MADFPDALNGLTSLQSALSQYVVRPLNAFGLGGFVFDIEGESRVELQNEITDHYIEDNSAVQDHIAVRPKEITLHNYVGELVYKQDPTTDTPLQSAVQKLTVLSAALPALTAGAQQAYNLFNQQMAGASSIGQAIVADASTGANIYGAVKNLLASQDSKQQQAYNYFKALRDQKILVAVQTPFEFMTNMAVKLVIGIQGPDSIYITNFSITLKEIRTASTADVIVGPAPADTQGRLASQAAPVTQQGIMPGLPVPVPAATYPNNVATIPDIAAVRKSSNFKYLGLAP